MDDFFGENLSKKTDDFLGYPSFGKPPPTNFLEGGIPPKKLDLDVWNRGKGEMPPKLRQGWNFGASSAECQRMSEVLPELLLIGNSETCQVVREYSTVAGKSTN